MEEGMKVTTLMTRKKDTVYSTGQMAESTKVAGKMVNSMVSVHIHPQAEKPNKANGKKVKDLIGFQAMLKELFNDQYYKLSFVSIFNSYFLIQKHQNNFELFLIKIKI